MDLRILLSSFCLKLSGKFKHFLSMLARLIKFCEVAGWIKPNVQGLPKWGNRISSALLTEAKVVYESK
jgi:hypothetical protein